LSGSPCHLQKCGGRKLFLIPDESATAPAPSALTDNTCLNTLVGELHRSKMLQEGVYQTIEEIAKAENINPSYVSRVLRFTLLAPEIGEAILAGRQPLGLTMARAMQPFLLEWTHQVSTFAKASSDIPAR
jgi:hypothetical protein